MPCVQRVWFYSHSIVHHINTGRANVLRNIIHNSLWLVCRLHLHVFSLDADQVVHDVNQTNCVVYRQDSTWMENPCNTTTHNNKIINSSLHTCRIYKTYLVTWRLQRCSANEVTCPQASAWWNGKLLKRARLCHHFNRYLPALQNNKQTKALVDWSEDIHSYYNISFLIW